MKTFKLELWPGNTALMGSIAIDNSAFISTFRVQQNEYRNPDKNMIKLAFEYAVEELQSTCQGVKVDATSATVTYEGQDRNEPHEIITAEKVHARLTAAGYRRKTG